MAFFLFENGTVILIAQLVLLMTLMPSTVLCGPCNFNEQRKVFSCEHLNLQIFPDTTHMHVKSYRLNGNNFAGISEKTFPSYFTEEIFIKGNKRPIRVDNDAFDHLNQTLRELSLYNLNHNLSSEIRFLRNLTKLRKLEIGNEYWQTRLNVTTKLIPREILHLLVSLRIVNSGVKDITKDALRGASDRLKHLGLPKNRLEKIPAGVKFILGSTKKTSTSLDLSDNKLRTLKQDWLPDKQCNLGSLNLARNRLQCLELHSLDNCPKLKSLDLRGNKDLLYLSPSLFSSTCKRPTLSIFIQNSGIKNLDFMLKNCVSWVYFWNAGVECDCLLKTLVDCDEANMAARQNLGDCIWRDGSRMSLPDALSMWSSLGCHSADYTHLPLAGCGHPLASKSDWKQCQIATPIPPLTTTRTTQPPEFVVDLPRLPTTKKDPHKLRSYIPEETIEVSKNLTHPQSKSVSRSSNTKRKQNIKNTSLTASTSDISRDSKNASTAVAVIRKDAFHFDHTAEPVSDGTSSTQVNSNDTTWLEMRVQHFVVSDSGTPTKTESTLVLFMSLGIYVVFLART